MKKFLMIFCVALVCATVFDSCSKKDDDSNDPQKQIIGKWKVTTVNLTLNGNPVTGDILEEAKENIGFTIEFGSDLSYTTKNVDGTIVTGTYLFINGVFKAKSTDETDYETPKITISQNQLIIHGTYEHSIIYDQELILARVN